MKKKVDFFCLPSEDDKARLERILNDDKCVIINRKDELNAKLCLALIYIEYEDYNDNQEEDE